MAIDDGFYFRDTQATATKQESDPNHDLLAAAGADDITKIFVSLKDGANVNTTDRHGDSALILASRHKGFNVSISMLCKHGADINHQNNDGQTACIETTKVGNHVSLVELIHQGADVNQQDILRQTALVFAIKKNDMDCTRMLLRHRADPNITDHKNRSPLFWAMLYGYDSCIQELLRCKAHTDDLSAGDRFKYEALLDAANPAFIIEKDGSITSTEKGLMGANSSYITINFNNKTVTANFDGEGKRTRPFMNLRDHHDEIKKAFDWCQRREHSVPMPFRDNAPRKINKRRTKRNGRHTPF